MASLTHSTLTPVLFTLPEAHLGSDDVIAELPRRAGRIETTRNGLVISSRVWKSVRKWRFRYNRISAANVATLRTFFNFGTMILCPYDVLAIQHVVRWVDDEFSAEYVSPGYYSMDFTLEEVIS